MREQSSTTDQIPRYLKETYSWAYVSDRAIKFWDRQWLINFVLQGNYRRLTNEVLALIPSSSRTIQLGSCYGNFLPRLADKTNGVDVVDCVEGQLQNLCYKTDKVTPIHSDAIDVHVPDNSYDVVLIFFLLHEMPADYRQRLLREAHRLVTPTGRVIILEFDKPHPLDPRGWYQRLIFKLFEPFASESLHWQFESLEEKRLCGGLYRLIILNKVLLERSLSDRFGVKSLKGDRSSV